MQLTFRKKYIDSMRMTMMLLMLALISDLALVAVKGSVTDGTLHEDDLCRTLTGERGVCTNITLCEEYVQKLHSKTIDYNSIFRCGFIGTMAVVCCPENNAPHTKTIIMDTLTKNLTRKTPITNIPDLRASKSDESKSTTWAPGWGVLIDTTTAAIPWTELLGGPLHSKTSATGGWGSLIDYPASSSDTTNGKGLGVNRIPTTKSSTAYKRPSAAACEKWRSFDPAGTTIHILDGEKVGTGDYPHVGALIGNITGGAPGELVKCGSSLIAERFILTAAHCVSDPLNLPSYVRFGVVNWKTDPDPVDGVILHRHIPKEYLSITGSDNDIAIIELKDAVELSAHVKPACLYTNEEDISSDIPLVVTGWGVTNVSTRDVSDHLLKTNVSTIPLSKCNKTYIDFRAQSQLSSTVLSEGQYCASDPGLEKDACNIDSGGPLQFTESKLSTIVGVVSFGHSCGSSIPSIYARVAHYLDWIESIVWPNGIP